MLLVLLVLLSIYRKKKYPLVEKKTYFPNTYYSDGSIGVWLTTCLPACPNFENKSKLFFSSDESYSILTHMCITCGYVDENDKYDEINDTYYNDNDKYDRATRE